MAIAYVSRTESAGNSVSQSSITTSVTVSSGTNRALILCVQARNSGVTHSVTSATFNGSESFTKVRADFIGTGASWQTEIWYLLNPTVTTANVVVNWASGAPDQAQGYTVVYLTGVAQSSVVDGQNGASNSAGTTLSCSVTTSVNNSWIVDSAICQDNGGLAVGANQTARTDRNLNIGPVDEGVGVSTCVKTTAGAETMDWTQLSALNWCMSAVGFKEAAGSTITADGGSYVVTGTAATTTKGDAPSGGAGKMMMMGVG